MSAQSRIVNSGSNTLNSEGIMAIVSTTEIKSLLNITSTTYDDQIGIFLPIALQEFFDYTNNYFDNNAVRLISAQITASSSDYTMVFSGGSFLTYSFAAGDEVRVRNSKRNDGFYTVLTLSSGTLTVASSSVSVATCYLRDETEGEASWTINKIDVPQAVKPLIAAMIKFHIDNPTGLVQSESLGEYSVTYGGGAYPSGITQQMQKYVCAGFV
jgi:hypothetical protein